MPPAPCGPRTSGRSVPADRRSCEFYVLHSVDLMQLYRSVLYCDRRFDAMVRYEPDECRLCECCAAFGSFRAPVVLFFIQYV